MSVTVVIIKQCDKQLAFLFWKLKLWHFSCLFFFLIKQVKTFQSKISSFFSNKNIILIKKERPTAMLLLKSLQNYYFCRLNFDLNTENFYFNKNIFLKRHVLTLKRRFFSNCQSIQKTKMCPKFIKPNKEEEITSFTRNELYFF